MIIMNTENNLFGISIFETFPRLSILNEIYGNYLLRDIYSLQNKIKMPKGLNPYFAGIDIPKDLLKNRTKFNLLVYGMENPYFIYRSDRK